MLKSGLSSQFEAPVEGDEGVEDDCEGLILADSDACSLMDLSCEFNVEFSFDGCGVDCEANVRLVTGWIGR